MSEAWKNGSLPKGPAAWCHWSHKSLQDFHYFWGSLVFLWLLNWRLNYLAQHLLRSDQMLHVHRLCKSGSWHCWFWNPNFWILATVQLSEQDVPLLLCLVHVCWHDWSSVLFCFTGLAMYSVPVYHKIAFLLNWGKCNSFLDLYLNYCLIFSECDRLSLKGKSVVQYPEF